MGAVDWRAIIGTVAPTLATALGGPLAGLAVSAVSQATLGKPDASKGEIAETIAKSADPGILVKLKEAEQAFAAKMKELDINLEKLAVEDRASARQREMSVRDATPRNLAYGYTIGYFLVLAFIVWQGAAINDKVKDMINVLLGVLSAAEVGIITYYFGSSVGSARKSDTIDQILEK